MVSFLNIMLMLISSHGTIGMGMMSNLIKCFIFHERRLPNRELINAIVKRTTIIMKTNIYNVFSEIQPIVGIGCNIAWWLLALLACWLLALFVVIVYRADALFLGF